MIERVNPVKPQGSNAVGYYTLTDQSVFNSVF